MSNNIYTPEEMAKLQNITTLLESSGVSMADINAAGLVSRNGVQNIEGSLVKNSGETFYTRQLPNNTNNILSKGILTEDQSKFIQDMNAKAYNIEHGNNTWDKPFQNIRIKRGVGDLLNGSINGASNKKIFSDLEKYANNNGINYSTIGDGLARIELAASGGANQRTIGELSADKWGATLTDLKSVREELVKASDKINDADRLLKRFDTFIETTAESFEKMGAEGAVKSVESTIYPNRTKINQILEANKGGNPLDIAKEIDTKLGLIGQDSLEGQLNKDIEGIKRKSYAPSVSQGFLNDPESNIARTSDNLKDTLKSKYGIDSSVVNIKNVNHTVDEMRTLRGRLASEVLNSQAHQKGNPFRIADNIDTHLRANGFENNLKDTVLGGVSLENALSANGYNSDISKLSVKTLGGTNQNVVNGYGERINTQSTTLATEKSLGNQAGNIDPKALNSMAVASGGLTAGLVIGAKMAPIAGGYFSVKDSMDRAKQHNFKELSLTDQFKVVAVDSILALNATINPWISGGVAVEEFVENLVGEDLNKFMPDSLMDDGRNVSYYIVDTMLHDADMQVAQVMDGSVSLSKLEGMGPDELKTLGALYKSGGTDMVKDMINMGNFSALNGLKDSVIAGIAQQAQDGLDPRVIINKEGVITASAKDFSGEGAIFIGDPKMAEAAAAVIEVNPNLIEKQGNENTMQAKVTSADPSQ